MEIRNSWFTVNHSVQTAAYEPAGVFFFGGADKLSLSQTPLLKIITCNPSLYLEENEVVAMGQMPHHVLKAS